MLPQVLGHVGQVASAHLLHFLTTRDRDENGNRPGAQECAALSSYFIQDTDSGEQGRSRQRTGNRCFQCSVRCREVSCPVRGQASRGWSPQGQAPQKEKVVRPQDAQGLDTASMAREATNSTSGTHGPLCQCVLHIPANSFPGWGPFWKRIFLGGLKLEH